MANRVLQVQGTVTDPATGEAGTLAGVLEFAGVTAPPPAAPALEAGAVSPSATIAAGGQVTLAWSAANATQVKISDGAGWEVVSLAGSKTYSPAATTSYVITATGDAGAQTSKTVVVTVVPAAPQVDPTASISVSPATVTPPGTATVAWQTANAAQVVVTRADASGVATVSVLTSGSLVVAPTQAATYKVTASRPGSADAVASASVAVAAPQVDPTASISVSPAVVTPPGTATVAWQTANAAQVVVTRADASGVATVSVLTSGSLVVAPTQAATYKVTASRPGSADAVATASVAVTAPPVEPPVPAGPLPRVTLTLSAQTIPAGGSVAAAWDVTGATKVWVTRDFDPLLGDYIKAPVPASGSLMDTPAGSRAYTIYAQNGTGPVINVSENVVVEPNIPAPRWDGVTFLTVPLPVTGTWPTNSFVIPDFGANPSISSARAGPWDDPATWDQNRAPRAGDVVRVLHRVSYNSHSDAVLDTVGIGNPAAATSAGWLEFAGSKKSRLTCCNVMVYKSGKLTLTSPTGPDRTAAIALAPAPYHAADAQKWGNMFYNAGSVEMAGHARASVVRVTKEPKAGDLTLEVAGAVNWEAGEKLVVGDSRQHDVLPWEEGYEPRTEVALVAGVSADGKRVTLHKPLQFDHPGRKNKDGVVTDWPWLGHLTKTVGVRTTDPLSPRRAHMICVPGSATNLRDVALHGTGRTTAAPYGAANVAYRNPLLLWGVQSANVAGVSSFDPTPIVARSNVRWGITLVDCDRGQVNVSDCVSFNWGGSGINTFGLSKGNTFRHNLVCKIHGHDHGTPGADVRGFTDMWYEGVAFGARGFQDVWEDNVACDAHMGYRVVGMSLPDEQKRVALAGFRGNVAYCCPEGLEIWDLGVAGNTPSANQPESVVDRFTAWHCASRGYDNYRVQNVRFQNCRLVNDFYWLARQRVGYGWIGTDYAAWDVRLVDCEVEGWMGGFSPSAVGRQYVKGGSWLNYWDFVMGVKWGAQGPAGSANTLPRLLEIDGVKVGALPFTHALDQPTPRSYIVRDTNLNTHNGSVNLLYEDRLVCKNWNGVPGDNFEVYFHDQKADTVLRPTTTDPDLIASPVPGKTNAQLLASHGVCRAGKIAPADAGPRAMVFGLVR